MARRHQPGLRAAEGRRFGVTVGMAFAALGALLWWRGRAGFAFGVEAAAVLLIAAGLLIPSRLGPVRKAWMAFAHAISKVTTPIAMSVVYFGVLMPTGLFRRAVGGNPLRHTKLKNSTWIRRGDAPRSNLERQF